MTAVSTVITSSFTVHASDSFITTPVGQGQFQILESQQTKIVRVPAFRGAISYWGCATLPADGSRWNTLRWLRTQAQTAAQERTAAAFAESLGHRLTLAMRASPFAAPLGLGMHFTAYELIDGYSIPEFFHIRNWTDATYTTLRPEGFRVTRETYGVLKGVHERPPTDGAPEARREVHAALHDGRIIYIFNNGDPVLFNAAAGSILNIIGEVQRRGHIRASDAATHRAMARRPIQIISELLSSFAKKESRVIGGKPHDLAISPDGSYSSDSGD